MCSVGEVTLVVGPVVKTSVDGLAQNVQRGSAILPGCTRKAVVALAEERQLRVEERAFSVEEALAAKEAFITSATVFVQAVVSIDGKKVGNGKPGPMTSRLREIYVDFARATAV